MSEDRTLESLLDLDGDEYVLDGQLGLWVKFEARRIEPNLKRPHGIRYSLTLHDRENKRVMGFDNAHAIKYDKKNNVAPQKVHDHWHRDENDKGHPYEYINAGKLVEDFWKEVEKILKKREEAI